MIHFRKSMLILSISSIAISLIQVYLNYDGVLVDIVLTCNHH